MSSRTTTTDSIKMSKQQQLDVGGKDYSSDVKMEDAKVTARILDDWSEFLKDREDKDRATAIEAVKATYVKCKKYHKNYRIL